MVTRGGPTRSAREAWKYFYDLLFSAEFHERTHTVCEEMGLTPGLMKALMFMDSTQATPMKGLASAWHCDASYVTSLIDGLEERNIVERRAHPTDRRAKTVALTPRGERLKAELLARLHEPPLFLNVLTVAEQQTLCVLLSKIVSAAGSANGSVVAAPTPDARRR